MGTFAGGAHESFNGLPYYSAEAARHSETNEEFIVFASVGPSRRTLLRPKMAAPGTCGLSAKDLLRDPSREAKIGKYVHFKGEEKIYRVFYEAAHSVTGEEFVVYKPLYGPIERQILLARPKIMFLEIVDKPEFNYAGPRFRYIGN